MIVGFTGTQEGMTENQAKEVWSFLRITLENGKVDFHHGDCVGADAEANQIARSLGCWSFAHPPIKKDKRAFTISDVVLETKEYMQRNQDIAEICDVLLAAPKEEIEELRSGTWSTIRRARKLGKEVIIIAP